MHPRYIPYTTIKLFDVSHTNGCYVLMVVGFAYNMKNNAAPLIYKFF
jgi:hypothetical protein